RLS
ncbi:HD domain protein, partial [Vibrio harveyi]